MAGVRRAVRRWMIEKTIPAALVVYPRMSGSTLAGFWRSIARRAKSPHTKERLERLAYLNQINHPWARWMKRILRQVSHRTAKTFVRNMYGNMWFRSREKRQAFKEKHGFLPPRVLVIDITRRCNLKCQGCWAALYEGGKNGDLDYDVLRRMIREARDEMGLHFFTITGGEPLICENSWRLYEEFNDCYFMVYTNGTLMTDENVRRLDRLSNCMLMISVEGSRAPTETRRGQGTYDKVMTAMDRLREAGIIFGFSVTPNRDNWDEIMSEEFIELMIRKGCLYGWLFQYVPIGRDPDVSLMIPPAARDEMRKRLYRLREKYPLFLVDFWNDGPEVGGCLAGGRGYLHIASNGDIEPCVFAHFTTHNLNDSTLTEALTSPLFTRIRENIPYEDGNCLRPCMLIDRPDVARGIWKECGARPTHPGADSLLSPEVAKGLDKYAAEVKSILDPVWEAGDWRRMWPDTDGSYRWQEKAGQT